MIGNSACSAYGASKAGVEQLSRVMAVDLTAYNKRVNVLTAGAVETRWSNRCIQRRPAGNGRNLFRSAVYLCSNVASYVTGHVMVVDGGFIAGGLLGPAPT